MDFLTNKNLRFFFLLGIGRSNSESGQTLIVAVLAIIVLFLAALFLFDLQSIIRLKVKTQTGADAAALAGAEMQVKSLNLVGEINIIKACTVLVSDFADGDTPEQLEAASENLTEMQARISFVGPLLGVGAAQQAAKNNGMKDYYTLTRDFGDYISTVADDTIYGNTDIFPQEIEGYHWRDPYLDMLSALFSGKMAAAPNVYTAEYSNGVFSDPSLYSAILANFWCHDGLRSLIKSDSNFAGPWWQGLVPSIQFIEESELMPLYVRYRSSTPTYDDALEPLTSMADDRNLQVSDLYDTDEPQDTDNINTPIPYMHWCCYDFRWDSNAPGNHWIDGSRQLYLRHGLRSEYVYGGAISFYRCVAENASWMSGSYRVNRLSSSKGVISKKKYDNEPPDVEATAAAKPLGYLDIDGNREAPNSISMILPVFKNARLTPTKMPPADNVATFGSEEWAIYKFLLWCDSVSDIDHPDSAPPEGTERYLTAFQKLNDPDWRHSGWNPSYSYSPPGEAVTYDPESDTGAGYLQMPVGNPRVEGSDGYLYDTDDNPVGISYTYDDLCDYVPPGGHGGIHRGGGGPGSLH